MAHDPRPTSAAKDNVRTRRARALRELLLLGLILAISAALRLHGLQWDDGQWLHPDERQIFFTALDLGWPHTLSEALRAASPLNPRFFAYGSLPIYLLRLAVELVRVVIPTFDLNQDLHLVARPLALLADLLTVLLTYRLARGTLLAKEREGRSARPAHLAAALVGLAVIHVQQARFYTADVLLTLFVLLTLSLAVEIEGASRWRRLALGASIGLALSTKVSAAPLLLVPIVACYGQVARSGPPRRLAHLPRPLAHALGMMRELALPLAACGLVLLLVQPYALIDWQTFFHDTWRESRIARGAHDVPYTIQYTNTLPVLYSIWQTALWGLGLPLGLAAWAGLANTLLRWLRRGSRQDALLLSWAAPYFVITALLYTKYLRYMLPLIPVLCVMAAQLVTPAAQHRARRRLLASAAGIVLLGASAAYTLLFVRIYANPHSWISASEWIYRNVPTGDSVGIEYWDMPLPLPLQVDGTAQRANKYEQRTLDLYGEPDDATKWEALAQDLAGCDYLILASRRLVASIPRQPDRYPITTRYYDLLLRGELGFQVVGEFTRGPAWLNPRVAPLPNAVPGWIIPDESFVVYDHPRTIVLRNDERLSATEVLRRLGVQ